MVSFLMCLLLILGCSCNKISRIFTDLNSSVGSSIIHTTHENYAIVGSIYSSINRNHDIWVILFNKTGIPYWNNTYGGSLDEEGFSIVEAYNGFGILGYTESYSLNGPDVWVIMIDQYGYTLWARTFLSSGTSIGMKIINDGSFGFIVAGYTNFLSAGDYDFLIVNIRQFEIPWYSIIGGRLDDRAYDITRSDDEGYIMVGYTRSFGEGNSDVFIVKTDSTGNHIWNTTFGGIREDVGYSIVATDSFLYFIVSGFTCSFGSGNADALLLSITRDGTVIWSRQYGDTKDDYVFSLTKTLRGDFLMTGVTDSYGAIKGDLWMIKTDASGQLLWDQLHGGNQPDKGLSIISLNDDVIAITGSSGSYESKSTSSRLWLLAINCSMGFYMARSGCLSCKAGTYSSAINSDNCISCVEGTYSNASSSSCTPCPTGTYNNKNEQSSCEKCPENTYNDMRGSTDATACKPCRLGEYSYKGFSSCIYCIKLTTNSTVDKPYFNLATNECFIGGCPSKFGIKDYSLCEPCSTYCLECFFSGNVGKCSKCEKGYKLDSNFCKKDETDYTVYIVIGTIGGVILLLAATYYIAAVCLSKSENGQEAQPDAGNNEPDAVPVSENYNRIEVPVPIASSRYANPISQEPAEYVYYDPSLPPAYQIQSAAFSNNIAPTIIQPPPQPPPQSKPPYVQPVPPQIMPPGAENANNAPEVIPQPLPPPPIKREDTMDKKDSDPVLCAICYDKEKNVAFFPCGHVVSCSDCAIKLTVCPLDRQPITEKKTIKIA